MVKIKKATNSPENIDEAYFIGMYDLEWLAKCTRGYFEEVLKTTIQDTPAYRLFQQQLNQADAILSQIDQDYDLEENA